MPLPVDRLCSIMKEMADQEKMDDATLNRDVAKLQPQSNLPVGKDGLRYGLAHASD